jgi:hypothetical protein
VRAIEHDFKRWVYSCLKLDGGDDICTAKWLGAKKHCMKSGGSDKADLETVTFWESSPVRQRI